MSFSIRAWTPMLEVSWNRRFLPSPAVSIAWAVLMLIGGYAFIVPWVTNVDPLSADFARSGLAPGAGGLFGTDSAGHDLFIRVAAGLRISLTIALTTAVGSSLFGMLLGILAGMTGGWVDRTITRLMDGMNALPHVLLGVIIVSLFRGSLLAIITSLVLTHWIQIARIVRAQILGLRHAEYVEAAWLSGMSRWQIIWYHLVPASLGQSMIGLVLLIPHAIWHESTLSFLGIGLPVHKASLGTLLADAQGALLLGQWWLLVFPSLFLIAVTLSIGIVGTNLTGRMNGVRGSI